MVEIVNVVGSGGLGVELDVSEVERDLPVSFTEHNPENYHGLYVRLVEKGPLITVYRSGKFIITGGSSLEEVEETKQAFLNILQDMEIISDATEVEFHIQNVVCTEDLGRSVNLNALAIGLGLESVEYEPEQFPGLIYRPLEISVVLLIFANGKVVITGSSQLQIAEKGFEHLQSRLGELGLE